MTMKKKILTTLSVVLILGMAALGILAYLTDQSEAKNTFSLSPDVAIELDEAKVTLEGDKYVVADPEVRVTENTYEAVYPSAVMPKDPTVRLEEGSADAYIRATVRVGNGMNWMTAGFPGYWNGEEAFYELVGNTVGTGWELVDISIDMMSEDRYGSDMVYTLIYKDKLSEDNSEATPVFEKIIFPANMTGETIKSMIGEEFNVDVTVEAVQAAGFADAKTAFAVIDGEATTIGSAEDLKDAKGVDGNYVLADDMTTDNIIHFGNGTDVTLDLNGKTVTAGNISQYAIGAQQGSTLHLTGNGTVNMGKGFMANKGGAEIIVDGGTYNTTVTGTLNNIKHASLAQNDSKIVINGGTFTTNVEDAVLFFATSNARVEINGGFFENTADKTPDLLGIGTNKNNTNRIVITGGTFVNYNPLNDRMCYTGAWPASGESAFGGPWILIPGDYQVVSETQENGDIWYSVVPK